MLVFAEAGADQSIGLGRWSGILRLPSQAESVVDPSFNATDEDLSLRLAPGGVVLLDLPGRKLFGLPLPGVENAGGLLAFSIGEGAAAIRFEGRLIRQDAVGIENGGADMDAGRIDGRVTQGAIRGSFSVYRAAPDVAYGEEVEVPVKGGLIRGSLVVPTGLMSGDPTGLRAGRPISGKGPFPLVIIVPGSGSTDRDGNNYQVPGKNDSLFDLAASLSDLGLASFRYDKRGVGESFSLAPDESSLSFDDYVTDLRSIIVFLAAEGRFGDLLVAGHTEGALVAAAALDGWSPPEVAIPAVALLAATAESAHDSFAAAIEAAAPEYVGEGREILAAIARGETWPHPSPYYDDFFRPSFQAYLSSWMRYDFATILPRLDSPLLLVQGDRDAQVGLGEFLRLAAFSPFSPALVVPGMNHVLKAVSPDVDDNYRSFSDPSFPLAPGLAEALAAFVRGGELPPGLIRVDGGRIPQGETLASPSTETEATPP